MRNSNETARLLVPFSQFQYREIRPTLSKKSDQTVFVGASGIFKTPRFCAGLLGITVGSAVGFRFNWFNDFGEFFGDEYIKKVTGTDGRYYCLCGKKFVVVYNG